MAERDLSDYVDVAERIEHFRAKYPEGSLQPLSYTEPWKLIQAQGFDKNGEIVQQTFIVVVAAAYRGPDDIHPGVGMAWEIFPGRTPYTRGSELQNAETSAWGRAIIAVGASDSKRGIASREEVRNRQAEREDVAPNCGCGHLKSHHIPDTDPAGCNQCDCNLLWNRDGSLSRSRTSDAEKAGAGVMTDAEQRAHSALERATLGTDSKGRTAGVANDIRRGVDSAVDDRWTTDAPSWLVGVDPPEDQPGSILPAQRSQIMAVYTALKITDREKRIDDLNAVLGWTADRPVFDKIGSVNELSHQQAARLLENLHERHTGKMTRR